MPSDPKSRLKPWAPLCLLGEDYQAYPIIMFSTPHIRAVTSLITLTILRMRRQ